MHLNLPELPKGAKNSTAVNVNFGADVPRRAMFFQSDTTDELGQRASATDGAVSALTGVATTCSAVLATVVPMADVFAEAGLSVEP